MNLQQRRFSLFKFLLKVIEFKWLIGPFPFPKFKFDFIASLTYLIPSSQDLIKSFYDKYAAIAEDNVHPVP